MPVLPVARGPLTYARSFASPSDRDALFDLQRWLDPVGLSIHLALAAAGIACAFTTTTVTEWAFLPLLICLLIRLTGHHQILRPLLVSPSFWLVLGFVGWTVLSSLWSPPGARPLADTRSLRFAVLIVLLWPVLDRRHVLVIAVLVGLGAGQCVQALHAASVLGHWSWQPFHRHADRLSGWWDPVVAGSLLSGGLGLWLAIALWARTGTLRTLGLAGSGLTLASILATGTRGAWIAAAALVIRALVIALCSLKRTHALALVGLVLLAAGITYAALGAKLESRATRGLTEVRSALASGDVRSDTGLRVAMWQWALAAGRTHPIIGVGAGGYQPWVRAQTESSARALNAPSEARDLVHAHAHSWYLHALATTGLVGVMLLGAMLALVIGSGLWPDLPAPSLALERAPALGLLGLCLAGLFDPITVNQQTSALAFVLIACAMPCRPRAVTLTGAPAPRSPGRGASA